MAWDDNPKSSKLTLAKSHSFSLSVRVENRLHEDILGETDECWFTVRPAEYALSADDTDATIAATAVQATTPNGQIFRFDIQASELNLDPDDEWYYSITYVTGGYSVPLLYGELEITPNVTNRGAGETFTGTAGVYETIATVQDRLLLTITSSMPVPEQGEDGLGIYITNEALSSVIDSSVEITAASIESIGRTLKVGDLLLSSATNEWVATITALNYTGAAVTSVDATTRLAIQGAKGDKGDTGDPGPAGTVAVSLSTDPDNLLELDGGDLVLLTPQAVQQAIPEGVVQMWAGQAGFPPDGWLICDGSVFSPTVYPRLYAAIGTSFGGTGAAPLLPNLKGRAVIGRDAADSSFNTVAKTGGAKTHTLTTAEMPAHNHTQSSHTHVQNAHTHTQDAHTHVQNAHTHSDGGHTHGPGTLEGYYKTRNDDNALSGTRGAIDSVFSTFNDQASAASVVLNNGLTNTGYASLAEVAPSILSSTAVNLDAIAINQPATPAIQNTGGGTAHNNMQPYIVLSFIIKADYEEVIH